MEKMNLFNDENSKKDRIAFYDTDTGKLRFATDFEQHELPDLLEKYKGCSCKITKNIGVVTDDLIQQYSHRDEIATVVSEYHKNLADTFKKYLDTVRFEIDSYVDRMTRDSVALCEQIKTSDKK